MNKKITLKEFLIYTDSLDKFIFNYSKDNNNLGDVEYYLNNWKFLKSNHINIFSWYNSIEGSKYWASLHISYENYLYNGEPLRNNKLCQI